MTSILEIVVEMILVAVADLQYGKKQMRVMDDVHVTWCDLV